MMRPALRRFMGVSGVTEIDPQSVTFVRASRPTQSVWFRPAQDRLRVESGEAQSFARFRVAVPARRELVSATLEVRAETTFVGSGTARSVDPAVPGAYRDMSWNTMPAAVAGSADRAATVTGRSLSWTVTADVASALAAGRERVAFRLSAGSASTQWLETKSLTLVLVTRPVSVDPTDLAPTGLVGTAKPVFSWTAPAGITKVHLQVSTSSTFGTTVYDSGELTATSPEVDTATGPAWSGLSGLMYVRVQHFTAAGWSAWLSAEVTYSAPTDFVVSNPGATDADPTPPSTWTPAAQSVEIISFLDGKRIGSTGLVPGPISTLTPTVGAKKAGQVLKRVYHFYDGQARTEPPFVQRVTETTFTPTATVAGLSSLTAFQVANSPAVYVSYERAAGVPDEVALYHGDDLRDIVPGTAPATDWTVPPNTDVFYGGRAVVNGKHSNDILTTFVRTRVGGVWLVDPITEQGFVLSGTDGLAIGYGGEVVVHTPIDGAVLLRRTLTRRGPEGSITGSLDPTGNLPSAWSPEDMLASVEWLADRPERTLRLICGDLNVPVSVSGLQAVFDPELSTVDAIWHTVSFAFSHAGGS